MAIFSTLSPPGVSFVISGYENSLIAHPKPASFIDETFLFKEALKTFPGGRNEICSSERTHHNAQLHQIMRTLFHKRQHQQKCSIGQSKTCSKSLNNFRIPQVDWQFNKKPIYS